jgi:hypothetical protein
VVNLIAENAESLAVILSTPHVILNEVKDLAAAGDASEIVTAPITARFFAVLRMT